MIAINGHTVVPTIFPDKTSQVWKLPETCFEGDDHTIYWEFEDEGELLHVGQCVVLLRHMSRGSRITLVMPYLPYARQDKDVSNTATFALTTFAAFINTLSLSAVRSYDVHSEQSANLIRRFEGSAHFPSLLRTFRICSPEVLFYPDVGAFHRYDKIFEFKNYAYGEKVREATTGAITEYSILGTAVLAGATVLVIDDICDGGATFILAAEQLRKMGVAKLNLYVTHGIFSKGVDVVRAAGYDRIFTWKGEEL